MSFFPTSLLVGKERVWCREWLSVVNKIRRGVSQSSEILGGSYRLIKPVLTLSWNRVPGNTEAKITVFSWKRSYWGITFKSVQIICELWVLDFVVTVEAACRVFQRVYSAKPSLGLVSVFQQGPFSGGSTSAHSCHEWNGWLSWRLGAEQADLVLLWGHCGSVCLGILLSIHGTISLSGYLEGFSCSHH